MVAAPLSDDELLSRSDLAGFARVVEVREGYARLRFTRLLKGRPRPAGLWAGLFGTRLAEVRLRARSEPMMLGDWTDEGAYQTGKQIKTFLTWNDRGKAYETCWWNAVSWL